MPKSLYQLKEDRYHLKYVLENLEMPEKARTIFQGLLEQIEEQITDLELPNWKN